jgi:hypothetical protein
MRAHRVRALLMGGQACVFYGAAEFSRDTDLVIVADSVNLGRLRNALAELRAEVNEVEFEKALQAEESEERERDRLHWLPLRVELEKLRHGTA